MSELDQMIADYEKGMTTREVAAKYGKAARTVARHLKAAGATMRNSGGYHNPKLDDAKWLKQEYNRGRSTTDIGEELKITASRVSYWLRYHGIETRSAGSQKGHKRVTKEARAKMSAAKRGRFIGADNPNWKGGICTADPERNRYPAKQWAAQVKERDDNKCVECGETEKLHSHHIKSWKDYPELRYELDNGITLCEECHQKAHGKGFIFSWNRQAQTTTSALPLKQG